MSTKDDKATELFEQALKGFEAAVKANFKLQKETNDLWTKMLGESGFPTEWQEKICSVANDTLPAMEKNAHEAIKLIEENGKSSLDLLKKAMETAQSASIEESKDKTHQLWEAYLETMRKNTKDFLDANSRAVKAWENLADKFTANPTAK